MLNRFAQSTFVLLVALLWSGPVFAQSELLRRTDLDHDGKGDLVRYSLAAADAGTWYVLQRGTNYTTAFSVKWGDGLEDAPVPADYDGDGKTDIAVFDTGGTDAGMWYILQGGSNFTTAFSVGPFGSADLVHIPVPADYDGDGRIDIAVYAGTGGDGGTWYILQGGTGFRTAFSVVWGDTGYDDYPVPRDYDGDGRVDIAVWDGVNFSPSPTDSGTWYILQGGTNYTTAFSVQWGTPGAATLYGVQVPVPGDYDGDGRQDIAFAQQSGSDAGRWYVLQGGTGFKTAFSVRVIGAEGGTGLFANEDTPVPGDYDGDGRYDMAVFKFATATNGDAGGWYVTQGGTTFTTAFLVAWGNGGEIPLSARNPQILRPGFGGRIY